MILLQDVLDHGYKKPLYEGISSNLFYKLSLIKSKGHNIFLKVALALWNICFIGLSPGNRSFSLKNNFILGNLLGGKGPKFGP